MKMVSEKSPGDISLVKGESILSELCSENSHQPSCEELTSKESVLFLLRLDILTASIDYLLYQGFDFMFLFKY